MNNNQSGFGIVNILIWIIFISIVTSAQTWSKAQDKSNQANATIKEIQYICEISQIYLLENGQWPNQANACAGAVTALTATPNPYMLNIDQLSPFNSNYITSCASNSFSVQVQTTNLYASYINTQSELPTVLVNSNTSITTIPRPLEDTLHEQFLALGLGLASRTYQAKGNAISGISNISLNGVSDTLLDLFNKQANFYTVENGESVIKPICTAGVSATIHLALTGLVASNNKIPYANPPYVDSQNTTSWTVGIDVYTEDGLSTSPALGTYALAITTCEG